MQAYAFKMHEPGSMGHEDMQWCPGLRRVDLKLVDEKLEFLMILGAQKAGTTWLHTELQRHDIFAQAAHAFMCVISSDTVPMALCLVLPCGAVVPVGSSWLWFALGCLLLELLFLLLACMTLIHRLRDLTQGWPEDKLTVAALCAVVKLRRRFDSSTTILWEPRRSIWRCSRLTRFERRWTASQPFSLTPPQSTCSRLLWHPE